MVASIVLLCNGIPMALAGILNVMLARTLVAIVLGLSIALLGTAMIAAAIRLYAGSRSWWIVGLSLVPIGAAGQFVDTYVFGDGRIPIVWGVIMPLAALVSLLLPSVKSALNPPNR